MACPDRVPIVRRVSRRARRLSLTIDAGAGVAELVIPRGVATAEADRFAAQHEDWAAARLAALPPRREFVDGAALPVLGATLRVRHEADAPCTVRQSGDRLIVGGPRAQVAARIGAWLRETARGMFHDRVERCAERLGRHARIIRIGDPRTRWGSCSPGGVLSFSWRLVLAPPNVTDYVAAHESAHLRERNHGIRFWSLVRELDPDYDKARTWLADNGKMLHRYGEPPGRRRSTGPGLGRVAGHEVVP